MQAFPFPHVAEYIPTVLIAKGITVFYERVEGFIPATYETCAFVPGRDQACLTTDFFYRLLILWTYYAEPTELSSSHRDAQKKGGIFDCKL